MNDVIALRGHIRSDTNPLTYEWSKAGSRYFPKAMVSNAENILRFLSLGYTPNSTNVDIILSCFNNVEIRQKNYLLQAVIDSTQHHFLYSMLKSIKTDEGRLLELLRIHDMWVLFFGAAIYKNNPISSLVNKYSALNRKWFIVSENNEEVSTGTECIDHEHMKEHAYSEKAVGNAGPTEAMKEAKRKHQSSDSHSLKHQKNSFIEDSEADKKTNGVSGLLDSVIRN